MIDPKTNWRVSRVHRVDVESTGTDPLLDRVIEVAIVTCDLGDVVSRRSWLVNPCCSIPESASAINHITNAMVDSAPTFADVLLDIGIAMNDGIPCAFSAKFDRAFIGAEWLRARAVVPPWLAAGVTWIDPLTFARHFQKFERGGKKLDAVAARLGVKVDGDAHRAACDAETALRVLLAFGRTRDMPEGYGALAEWQRMIDAQQQAEFSKWRYQKSYEDAEREEPRKASA